MRSKWFKDFGSDERGSATVESLFWVPLFVYLLVLITDVSIMFYAKAQALRIVQDGNRAYSVQFLGTKSETENFILTRLKEYSPTATVSTNEVNGIIETVAKLKASELMSIGSLPGFANLEITISAQHYKEL